MQLSSTPSGGGREPGKEKVALVDRGAAARFHLDIWSVWQQLVMAAFPRRPDPRLARSGMTPAVAAYQVPRLDATLVSSLRILLFSLPESAGSARAALGTANSVHSITSTPSGLLLLPPTCQRPAACGDHALVALSMQNKWLREVLQPPPSIMTCVHLAGWLDDGLPPPTGCVKQALPCYGIPAPPPSLVRGRHSTAQPAGGLAASWKASATPGHGDLQVQAADFAPP